MKGILFTFEKKLASKKRLCRRLIQQLMDKDEHIN